MLVELKGYPFGTYSFHLILELTPALIVDRELSAVTQYGLP